MELNALLGLHMTVPPDVGNVAITGLTADSRKAAPGFLFAALSGTRTDGARFVAEALSKGAIAVLGAPAIAAQVPPGIAFLASDEPRRALALAAAKFYGAQPEVAVAVTGTSGKTSVADFTRQIFTVCGHVAASLGTIGLVKADGSVYGSLTTPDPVTLHKDLAALAHEGVTHLAFEASSHGLDQHRLDGVALKAAAFTNLGRDHLDYHPTMEAYLTAKLRLFRDLLPVGAPAVINSDDIVSREVIAAVERAGRKVLTVGTAGAYLRLVKARRSGFAQHLTIAHRGQTYDVDLPLIGAYQASNALLAAGLSIAAGDAPDAVLPALRTLKGVKGRLEIAGRARGGLIVIDYAHKPEALTAALSASREFATGRLVCVFGCGGDRDKGKRPIMGAIAEKLADVTIVTDDNPRGEKPAAIRAEILAAAPSAREIGDRAEAIRTGIALLREGDVLVIAGKGHETGQIVGASVLPFSDHEAVAAALAEGPDA